MNEKKYRDYLTQKNLLNIDFKIKWLKKAEKLVGKSVEYMLYNEETLIESIKIIRQNARHKPNRMVNQIRNYKDMLKES